MALTRDLVRCSLDEIARTANKSTVGKKGSYERPDKNFRTIVIVFYRTRSLDCNMLHGIIYPELCAACTSPDGRDILTTASIGLQKKKITVLHWIVSSHGMKKKTFIQDSGTTMKIIIKQKLKREMPTTQYNAGACRSALIFSWTHFSDVTTTLWRCHQEFWKYKKRGGKDQKNIISDGTFGTFQKNPTEHKR